MRAMHEDGQETAEGDLSQAKDLAARIRVLRKSLGLSQASFAKRVGVDQSNVSRWENGAQPDDAHIVRLAELAGRHPAAFRYGRIPETGSEPPPAMVPVVGYVGAGQEIFALDDHALGAGLEEVEAAGDGAGGRLCRRRPGDIRLGRPCARRRAGGGRGARGRGRGPHGRGAGARRVHAPPARRLATVLPARPARRARGLPEPLMHRQAGERRPGPGLQRGYRAGHFVLSSWNAPPIEDVRLDWAAPVLSIRP
jgi:transcriptional regulator with XRE-family HTH domain